MVWGAYGQGLLRQIAGSLENIRQLQGTLGMPELLLQPGSTVIGRYVGPPHNSQHSLCLPGSQWKANATVSPYRLPTKGPGFPFSFPALVLVTKSLHVEVWYLRARHVNFNFLRATLTHGASGHEAQPPVSLAPHMSEGGTKLCVTAAIGVMYDGKSSTLWNKTKC